MELLTFPLASMLLLLLTIAARERPKEIRSPTRKMLNEAGKKR